MVSLEILGHFALVLRMTIARRRREHIHHCDSNESRMDRHRFVEDMGWLISRARLRRATDDVAPSLRVKTESSEESRKW